MPDSGAREPHGGRDPSETTTSPDGASREDARRIERAIEERVCARAQAWFPELGAAPQAALSLLSARPRCSLYVVHLVGDDSTRRVLAKVRRGEPDHGRAPTRPPRPRLRTVSAGVGELTELEYEGLARIHGWVEAGHSSFRAVRPLDHLPAESVVIMDYVTAPTLRQAFIDESRLAVVRRSPRRGAPPSAWRNAGAWLRGFHDLSDGRARPARQSRRPEVVERFHAYGDFLTERLGPHPVGDLAGVGARLASELLPERLTLCVGHGDYVPRNMFVDTTGRVTVFDPMPRWRVPVLEDVCRFVVGMRLSGLQVNSHGAAYGRRGLDRREDMFLSGYFGADQVPYAQVRCYQLLILLDKWSALVDSAVGRSGRLARARAALMRPANAYASREARRLVALLG